MNILGIDIELIGHSSVLIRGGGKKIYIDPYKLPNSELEKADIILITHHHFDHCSPEDIKRISNEQTIILTNEICQKEAFNIVSKENILVKPGERIEVEGIKIETVPAYNIDKFRSPGVPYHPREENHVGYIIEIKGKRIYHAGDTDNIPEMKNIDVDIALLPVSGKYVMTAEEAAEATKAMKRCEVAIPMHYGVIVGTKNDANLFSEKAGCKVIKLI